ncbi:MAG: patatin-like phospholipase family protein [Acidimicrobiales bacterium]
MTAMHPPDLERTERSEPAPPAATDDVPWPRPLAFVLSGGGAFGATQVGMLAALTDHGIAPDLVVGTSVGALNGAVVADDPAGAAARLAEIWTHPDMGSPFGAGRWRAMIDFLRWRRSLCPPHRLVAVIETWTTARCFDELAVPFALVVTDATTGAPTVLHDGPLQPALLATTAIPGVFPPVSIDGQWYIDGGVTANVPVRQAVGLGARALIVLDAVPPAPPPPVPTSIVSALINASGMALRAQQARDLDPLDGPVPVLRLPPSTPVGSSSFDFSAAPSLIAEARRQTGALLDSLPLRLGKPALFA